MSLFQIDYLKKTGALMKEALTLKKYKAMHPAFAIFVGIFMSPFLIAGLLLTAILAIFAFVCNLILTPLSHIYSLFHNEAKDVKHATQFLIYLVSWPLFFLAYFVFSWVFIITYILYAILSIDMYVFTLGGFKFHVFPGADSHDIAIKVKGRYLALPIVTICISAVLLIAIVIFGSLGAVASMEASELYDEYSDLADAYNKLNKDTNKSTVKTEETEEPENNDDLVAPAAEVEEEEEPVEEEVPEEGDDDLVDRLDVDTNDSGPSGGGAGGPEMPDMGGSEETAEEPTGAETEVGTLPTPDELGMDFTDNGQF